MHMKTVVLDATELSRDWFCSGLVYQIIEHSEHFNWLNIVVPPSAFEETVANHRRKAEEASEALERLNTARKRLHLEPFSALDDDIDYRRHLAERFDYRLGISVLPWPAVSHEDLVARAIARTPPFDAKGSGYRDSLVWANVIELARTGTDVALVSADRVFADKDGTLASVLAAEVDPLPGSVELVQEFGPWLLKQLPWEADSLGSAVATSRNEAFYNYFLHSDLQADITPPVESLGFNVAPHSWHVEDVAWGGHLQAVDTRTGPDGLAQVEYEIDEDVFFVATFPGGIETAPSWRESEPNVFGQVDVRGDVHMLVSVVVVFGDEFGFGIEEMRWRRADGTEPGRPMAVIDPQQLPLPDIDLFT